MIKIKNTIFQNNYLNFITTTFVYKGIKVVIMYKPQGRVIESIDAKGILEQTVFANTQDYLSFFSTFYEEIQKQTKPESLKLVCSVADGLTELIFENSAKKNLND